MKKGRILVLIGVLSLVTALGFVLQWSWAIDLWPWAESRLSYVFVGSEFAAIAAALIWIGASRSWRATEPGGLDFAIAYTGIAPFLFWRYLDAKSTRLLVGTIFCAVGWVLSVVVARWGHRQPVHDPRPTPRLVQVSFAVFALVLVIVGGSLVSGHAGILPWGLSRESGILIGLMFLGDAAFFFHGFLYPTWENGFVQLLAFGAYDAAILIPLLQKFSTVAPGQLPQLVIYLVVVAYSGVLAIYYLLINRPTRASLTPAG